jgi:hypothetical protein
MAGNFHQRLAGANIPNQQFVFPTSRHQNADEINVNYMELIIIL